MAPFCLLATGFRHRKRRSPRARSCAHGGRHGADFPADETAAERAIRRQRAPRPSKFRRRHHPAARLDDANHRTARRESGAAGGGTWAGLPVAPRPYRDELLSSWLGGSPALWSRRVPGLGRSPLRGRGRRRAHDLDRRRRAAERGHHVLGAASASIGAPLSRLTLARRRPGRAKAWFSSEGPPWALMAARTRQSAAPARGRSRRRTRRLSAGRLAAGGALRLPRHRQLLRDRCSRCHARLRLAFRLRDGRARLVCGRCGSGFVAQAAPQEQDGALIDALISLQDRIGAIVRGPSQRRKRLEEAASTLWEPCSTIPGPRGRRWRCRSTKWMAVPGRGPGRLFAAFRSRALSFPGACDLNSPFDALFASGSKTTALIRRRGIGWLAAPPSQAARASPTACRGCFLPGTAGNAELRRQSPLWRVGSWRSRLDGCRRAVGKSA